MKLRDKLYTYSLASCVTFTAVMAVQSLVSTGRLWSSIEVLIILGMSILINLFMLVTDLLRLKECWWGRCLDVVLIVLVILGLNWLVNPAALTTGNILLALVACPGIYAVVFACMDHMLKREADCINRMLEEKKQR